MGEYVTLFAWTAKFVNGHVNFILFAQVFRLLAQAIASHHSIVSVPFAHNLTRRSFILEFFAALQWVHVY
jgi:hypothetical protein